MITFRDYMGNGERYLLEASQKKMNGSDLNYLLIPAVISAWSSIESFVNSMLDDFSALPEDMFALHERAFLLEKRIKFHDAGSMKGKFNLAGTEYRRLEDKILFLIAKFGDIEQLSKGDGLWQRFKQFKQIRDQLVHPKKLCIEPFDIEDVQAHLQTARDVISLVGLHVWGKKVDF